MVYNSLAGLALSRGKGHPQEIREVWANHAFRSLKRNKQVFNSPKPITYQMFNQKFTPESVLFWNKKSKTRCF
jgi:hypothetical protein